MLRYHARRNKPKQPGKRWKDFFAAFFSSIPDGISVVDLNFNLVQVNSTVEKWFSQTRPLVGKKCYKAYHGRSEPCQPCPASRAVLGR